jgi:F-type H+-transporting ATPase subunit b
MKELLPVVFTHFVAFLLFLWVIKTFAVGPVLNLLDQRRKQIADQYDDITAKNKRVDGLREEYEEHLREIEEEARKRVQEEVTRARRISEEIVEAARAEAAQFIEKARQNTQIQVEQARAELKDEVINLTLATTERLLREKLDDTRHRQLVGTFLDELKQRN